MNPPSALHGAMSRDRKPFTYTPGGLDLSEIKSSRMAARLMRNAMNEGVPELPKHSQPTSTSSTSIVVPNFNCLPVQVFPTFNLPANPKSLLRTRSNPGQPRDLPMHRMPPPQLQSSQLVNKAPSTTHSNTFNKNTLPCSQINNNRPVSMFEYGSPAATYTPKSYENNGCASDFPEISYDAEYLQMQPRINNNIIVSPVETIKTENNINKSNKTNIMNEDITFPFEVTSPYQSYSDGTFTSATDIEENSLPFNESSIYQEYLDNALKPNFENIKLTVPFCQTSQKPSTTDSACNLDIAHREIDVPSIESNHCLENDTDKYYPALEKYENDTALTELIDNQIDMENTTLDLDNRRLSFSSAKNDENAVYDFAPENKSSQIVLNTCLQSTGDYSTFASDDIKIPKEELSGPDDKKKEIKVTKKQEINQNNNVQDQNGSNDLHESNGDETDLKKSSKSSTAKSTKIEVTKKTLPDGSIEEVKKTITTTTIDGRTEIKTKTETTIIPKEDDDEEEYEEVEEEEEKNEHTNEKENEKSLDQEKPNARIVQNTTEEQAKCKENGDVNIINTSEKSETITTSSKKVIVIHDDEKENKEEEEQQVTEEEDNAEVDDTEPVTFIIKQPPKTSDPLPKELTEVTQEKDVERKQVDKEEEEEEEVDEDKEAKNDEMKEKEIPTKNVNKDQETEDPKLSEKDDDDEEVEDEEEYEEAEEKDTIDKGADVSEPVNETSVQYTKESNDEEQADANIEKKVSEEFTEVEKTSKDANFSEVENVDNKQEQIQEVTEEKQEVLVEEEELKSKKQILFEETLKEKVEKSETLQQKCPLREPSVPLEKVEDIEIKPIGLGDYLTKSHTENTEIITNITEKPTGLLTEINRIENIVTVNRTTKTLDHSYETITQQGIPTVKTYFSPHIEKISTSPQPARPYQPVYPPEPVTERRHSLLLERLSVERQIPTDVYQNNYQYSNQSTEQQRQWSQEPQAEVLTVSNVKPSQITNQQWYQQKENAIYNNLAPSPQPAQTTTPSWTQPKSQPQPIHQLQSQYQPQPQYQPLPQYQSQPQYQPQYQPPPQPQSQPQYQVPFQSQTQTEYQPTFTENNQENASNTYQNTYSSYAAKPSNWASNFTKPLSPIPTIITPSQPDHFNYIKKDSTESYQTTRQHHSSSYVPPPWEQESNYVTPAVSSQNYNQPSPQINSFTPAPNEGWKPNFSSNKFSKTSPTAYIPPKPNQSFVKPVIVEPPKMPGRKTYYSEYERRYISVPESTYIPGESKFQPQPDPSPAYYYDNNETAETVEPQWRRELREFTEKSQSQTTETNVKPPWEAETKHAKAPQQTYTPTPTWSQTVRPQSWRERSFESEFVSQEWPKTNTLGRGRPLSSYGKETIPERTRGVSVDRYNPNSYQAPVAAEHPPVQTHTHLPPAPHATGYHNPNVPAYHARASAEPREQVSYQQPRNYREARASPFQSRSFKYLQWITGTED